MIGARIAWLLGTYLLARAQPAGAAGRPRAVVAGEGGDRLVRDARRGLARRSARAAAHDRRGRSFPDRDLIIFLTFGVIFATLVLQGLTLPPLIRVLDLDDGGVGEKEEAKARIRAAEAALERLDELDRRGLGARGHRRARCAGSTASGRSASARASTPTATASVEERSQDYQRLRRELLDAEREAVAELRREGTIGDDVMRRVVRDLDLEDARLDV